MKESRLAALRSGMSKQAVVLAVRERDGFRCTDCGITEEQHLAERGLALDVHRKTPGSVYTLDGCITLCRSCHGPKPKRPRGKGVPDLENSRRMAGVRNSLAVQLDIVVARHSTDFTEEVNRAVREYLERFNLWPVPPNA